jgi:hypothetical protein
MQKEEFSITCHMCDTYTWRSIFIRDNPIFSSERILHKDYGRKSSFAQKTISSLFVSLKGLEARTK